MQHSQRSRYLSWLKGQGLEIGGLNRPLPLPQDVSVVYSDVLTPEKIAELYPGSKQPEILSDSESFPSIETGRFDFVIANHVLEHVTDPIGALQEWHRILKPAGILYLAVPDRRFTFDHKRKRTSLAHLIDDHNKRSVIEQRDLNLDHLKEWATHVEGLDPASDAWKAWVDAQYQQGYSVHNHVWEIQDIFKLLEYLSARADFELVAWNDTPQNDLEFILILKKTNHPVTDFRAMARWQGLVHLMQIALLKCDWPTVKSKAQAFLQRGHLR